MYSTRADSRAPAAAVSPVKRRRKRFGPVTVMSYLVSPGEAPTGAVPVSVWL